jgi:hypothetical protein
LETEYEQALAKWRKERDVANQAMVDAAKKNTGV